MHTLVSSFYVDLWKSEIGCSKFEMSLSEVNVSFFYLVHDVTVAGSILYTGQSTFPLNPDFIANRRRK